MTILEISPTDEELETMSDLADRFGNLSARMIAEGHTFEEVVGALFTITAEMAEQTLPQVH